MKCNVCVWQTEWGAGGGGAAATGMSGEVVARLQERATALTQERKRRGRTVPEGLLSHEQIRAFNTLASHPVTTIPLLYTQDKHTAYLHVHTVLCTEVEA